MATLSREVEAEIDHHLAKYPVKRSRHSAPDVHACSAKRGYLDPPGVVLSAKRLNLRITDIWEVATFYSMIHITPIGKYHIQVCKPFRASCLAPTNHQALCGKAGH